MDEQKKPAQPEITEFKEPEAQHKVAKPAYVPGDTPAGRRPTTFLLEAAVKW